MEKLLERTRILIVDDEKFVRRTVARVLESEGMDTVEASNGPDAIRLAQKQQFDLIILDVVMDAMDGFQVIHRLRELGILTPVFILSGRQADTDKIFALGIGADDYITKPFSTTVLCAKVKAYLRRIGLNQKSCSQILNLGPFCYLCDEMRLFKNGIEIPLASKESFLIKYFMQNPERILTREQIYNHVWGNHIVDDNTIMVHIRRLRMKIEDDPNRTDFLKTIRGVGYKFVVEEA